MRLQILIIAGLGIRKVVCNVLLQRQAWNITSGYSNTTLATTITTTSLTTLVATGLYTSPSNSASMSSAASSSSESTPSLSSSTSIPAQTPSLSDAPSSKVTLVPISSVFNSETLLPNSSTSPSTTRASSAKSSLASSGGLPSSSIYNSTSDPTSSSPPTLSNESASSKWVPSIVVPASVITSSVPLSYNTSASSLIVPITGSPLWTTISSKPNIPSSGSVPFSMVLPSSYVSPKTSSSDSSSSPSSSASPSTLVSSEGLPYGIFAGSAYSGTSSGPPQRPSFSISSSKVLPLTIGPATASSPNINTISVSSSTLSSTGSNGYSYSFNASGFVPQSGTGTYPYGSGKPTGMGLPPGHPNKPPSFNVSSNATCSGSTFNIISGSLDWWYTSVIVFGASTFSQQYDYNQSATAWTLLPATTTFNVTSALAQPTFSSYTTFNTYVNMSLIYESEYITATPVFVSTAIVTQTAMNPVNTTSGTGPIPSNVILTPAPASTVLSGPSTAALTALTNTAFVYFTEYAIDRQQRVSYSNGSRACTTAREIYTLSAPYAIYYGGPDPDGQTEVGGALPTDILEQLHLSEESVTLGSWAASPTLLVVVQVVYAAQSISAAAATATSLATLSLVEPETTLLTPAPALAPTAVIAVTQTALETPGNFIVPAGVAWLAHIEVTQTSLDVASTTLLTVDVGTDSNPTVVLFVGHLGVSEVTFLAPEPTGGDIITTTIEGSIVVATPLTSNLAVTPASPASPTAVALPQSLPINSPGIGAIVSAIQAGSGSSESTSGSSGSGSGSSGSGSVSGMSSGSSGTSGGSGTNNNPAPAQPNPGIGGLVSAIESVAQQSGIAPLATAVANPGSSSGDASSAGHSAGSSSEGSSSSGSTLGGSSAAGASSDGSLSDGPSSGSSSSEGNTGTSGSSGISSGSSGSSGSESGSELSLGGAVPIPISLGSIQTTVGPSSKITLGTQTLVPGGREITVSGTPISLGPSAIVIGAVTHSFVASAAPVPGPIEAGSSTSPVVVASVITLGHSAITQAPVPVFAVGGQTLPLGGVVTVSGTIISAASSGGAIIIGSKTIPFAAPVSAVTLTTAGQTITINPTPAYLVQGQTLVAGGPAITVDGTYLSLAPSATAILVGSSTSDLTLTATSAQAAAPPFLTIGSDTFTANAATQFLLASGIILTPGGVATISGTTVSLDSSASEAVVNGVTEVLSLPVVTPAPLITLGGMVYEANIDSMYEVGGQVLTPGGVITVSGSTLSLVSGASAIVVNGVTKTIAPMVSPSLSAGLTVAPVLTVAGKMYTANSGSSYIISGQTLTPGGTITLSGGTKLSLAPSASVVIINGVTSTPPHGPIKTSLPTLTVNGQTYVANSGSSYMIDGQTLTPGGLVTLPGGPTLSLAPSGLGLVINGVTSTVSTVPITTSGPELTIGGKIYTAGSGSSYLIDGQTLTPGGAITLSGGTTISLAPSASDLVINGATSAISAPTITAAPILTIDDQTYTADSQGATYIISGQTLTPGGTITISSPNGPETISLTPDTTALIIAVSGATTTSTLPTAYGPLQTPAPILSIGTEIFTALPGAGPSYLINGQTLIAGGAALTETISGHVYILSLSPSATVLEIEEEGPGGRVTATEYETLFPATLTRGRGTATITDVLGGGAGTTGGSASTGETAGASGTPGPEASLQNSAVSDRSVGVLVACFVGAVAGLAVML